MLTSLKLVQDDDLDLLRDVEQAFDIRIPPEASMPMRTLGDLHRWLLNTLPPAQSGGRCPSAMAFYRLRQAAKSVEITEQIRPVTPLDALAAKPARFLRRLQKQTQLVLPAAKLRWTGRMGSALVAICLLVGIVAAANGNLLHAVVSAGGLAFGAILMLLDRGAFPGGLLTFGDLSRRAAALNRKALKLEGARHIAGEEWDALAAIAAELTALPADQIEPETFFYQEDYERSVREGAVA